MKKQSRQLKLAVAASLILALIVVGVALAANVIIDTFDVASQSLTASPSTPNVNGSGSDASILGGVRDVQVNWVSGPGQVSVQVNQFSSGRLAFTQGDGVAGNATVTWDGSGNNTLDPGGLCNPTCSDLTGGGTNDGIHFEVLFDDLAIDVQFRVFSGSASDFEYYDLQLPGGIPAGSHVDFFVPFTSFSAQGSGANFANAGAVQVFIDGSISPGADMSISFFEVDSERDHGDAPASYGNPTNLPNGVRLGSNVDIEPGTLYSADATGDDTDQAPPDDEDGVVRTSGVNWSPGTIGSGNGGSVDVTMSGCSTASCYVTGWIDWGGDGSFDASDRVITDGVINLNGTAKTFTFDIPGGTVVNNSSFYARFRIYPASTGGSASPTDEVTGGEVEDYYWGFGPTAITLSSLTARSNPSGDVSLYLAALVALILLGLGAYIWLQRRKA